MYSILDLVFIFISYTTLLLLITNEILFKHTKIMFSIDIIKYDIISKIFLIIFLMVVIMRMVLF